MAGLFSIIMPVYNVEEYLTEAIESVLAQSYKDFELIIVNDGSTDGSAVIAEKFANHDKRLRVINQRNKGLSSARNEGIKHASGVYLYFLDSDDFINYNTLEFIYDVFLHNNVEIVAFAALPFFEKEYYENNALMLEVSDNHYSRDFLKEGVYSCNDYYENCTLHNNFVVSACLYIVKKSKLDCLRLKFQEGIIHEDALFTRQLFLACNTVYFTKNKFYNRRIRGNSISTSIVSAHKAYSYLIIAEELNSLNITSKKKSLNEDVIHFYNECIRFLKSIEKRTNEYDKVIKHLFRSNLSKQYKISFRTTVELKYKNLEILRKFSARLRYRLGLRTRLKFLIKWFK